MSGHNMGIPHTLPLGTMVVAHIVKDGRVTAWLGQQQPNSVQSPVLAGTHQRCGPVCILCVHISPTLQQGCHHVLAAVADGQHEGCLSCLGNKEEVGKGGQKLHLTLKIEAIPAPALLQSGGVHTPGWLWHSRHPY